MSVPTVPDCADQIPAQSLMTVPPPFKGGTDQSVTHTPGSSVPRGNSGTVTPGWLQERINTSRRAARPNPCPKCGTDTLVGPDHDTCSLTARVDTAPADPLTEVIALLAGRESYDLDRGELHHRTPEHHHSNRRPHPVLLEHRCADTDPEGLF